jgi:hypothetical protein
MASKVNLKKYIAVGDRWRFVPVLKVDDRPESSSSMACRRRELRGPSTWNGGRTASVSRNRAV